VRSAVARRRAIGKGSSAVLDQLLSSSSQLLLTVLVAREGGAATFGALSVALVSHGFVLGCVRAVVGEVAVVRLRRAPGRQVAEARVTLLLGLCTSAVAAAGFLLASFLIGGSIGTFLALFALAAPFVQVQDLRRYLAFAEGRVGHAIALDGTWLAVQVVVSSFLIVSGSATAERLVLAWIAGAAISALAAVIVGRWRPSSATLRTWLRDDGTRAASFVGDFVVSTGLTQAAFLALGAILSLEEFGGLRLVFVSLSPLANALAGIRALTLGQYTRLRDDPTRARGIALAVAAVFGGLSAAYGLALVLAPVSWGEAVLGDGWSEAHRYVGVLAIGEALRMASFPAIDLIKSSSRPLALVRTRVVLAAIGVVALVSGALLGGPLWAAINATGAAAISALVWWRTAVAAVRVPSPEATAAPRQ
jgi:hypothetical protein